MWIFLFSFLAKTYAWFAGVTSVNVDIGINRTTVNYTHLKVTEITYLMKLTAVMSTHIFIFTAMVTFSVTVFL